MGVGASALSLSGTVRVMALGDSMTDYADDADGWIQVLSTALAARLPDVTIEWVGSEGTSPWEHEGDPGAALSGIRINLAASQTTEAPDLILLLGGTNDAHPTAGGGAYDAATSTAAIAGLLADAKAVNSDVQFVVTSPVIPNPATVSDNATAHRAGVADIGPRIIQATREEALLYVDGSALALVSGDFIDHVHFAPTGDAKYAVHIEDKVVEGIGRVLAPARYSQVAEIVSDPTLSAPVVGASAAITAGAVDAFPTIPTSTFRVLDDADDSEVADLGALTAWTPLLGDSGKSVKVEQTAGGDVRVGPTSAVTSGVSMPTSGLVYAIEARAGVTESGGLVTEALGQHGTTADGTATGTARPDYLATSGINSGPTFRFGASATNTTSTLLDMSEDLRGTAGDSCISVLVNPSVLLGDQQWLMGFTGLYGPLHIRGSSTDEPHWYDGAYARAAGVDSTTGWQLLTFYQDGTDVTVYRGRTEIASLTVTERALTAGTLCNIPGGGFPFDGLCEAAYAFDTLPTLSELWDYIEQEYPGAAPGPDTLDVFVLGHSAFGHEIPNHWQRAVDQDADPAVALDLDYGIGNGASLEYHRLNPTSGEGENATVALSAQPYDVLGLLEAVPIDDSYEFANTVTNILHFANQARAENADVQVYLCETWEDRVLTTGGLRLAIDTRRTYYERLLTETDALFAGSNLLLVPCAQALGMLMDEVDDDNVSDVADIDALFADDIHPSPITAYFMMCVWYATIHQRSPVGLPIPTLDRFGSAIASVPTAAMAADMQAIAWAAVQADPLSGVDAVVGPPTLVSITPASMSDDFDVEGNITATFSTTMNAATIYAETLLLIDEDGVTVPAAYSTVGDTVTINPTNPLDNTTMYTVVATTAIQNDSGGVNMVANRAMSFESGVALVTPALSYVFPADEATGVTWNNIEIHFDVAMDPTTMTASEITITEDGGAKTATISYPSASSVRMVVDGGQLSGADYVVTLAGAESADGVAAATVTFGFTIA